MSAATICQPPKETPDHFNAQLANLTAALPIDMHARGLRPAVHLIRLIQVQNYFAISVEV